MRILPAGRSARLVEVDDLQQMLALYAALEDAAIEGIIDLVPAARTVLVVFDDDVLRADDLERRIDRLRLAARPHQPTEPLRVPTSYDGADLDIVCELMGMSRAEFISWHTGTEWYVAFGGFAPGFGYLVADAHTFSVPRLTTPRTSVPAGAVAMAGEFTGIYPRSSPGGWQIVGHTESVLFDLAQDPPSQLLPGRHVLFVDGQADATAATRAAVGGRR